MVSTDADRVFEIRSTAVPISNPSTRRRLISNTSLVSETAGSTTGLIAGPTRINLPPPIPYQSDLLSAPSEDMFSETASISSALGNCQTEELGGKYGRLLEQTRMYKNKFSRRIPERIHKTRFAFLC
ncbi:unnamed protein product [Protopolystoma xenopodis]|uniref:Uncharacterized protein n=1 Tax=Protopolystoma xenopodis TaxID=117903 RepID=A0A3S5BTA1_9PLAT|nr:unnamed protein product [Protopolystoma xenopodis]